MSAPLVPNHLVTIVQGVADDLESSLEGRDAEDVELIQNRAEHLVTMAEKTRELTELPLLADGTQTTIDAVQHLQALVEEMRGTYPAAEFDLQFPDEAPIVIIDPEPFRMAVRNVLDNAISHNDAPDPWLAIRVERTAEGRRIDIADNGPGIPEIERRAIGADIERPLIHSGGMGLWLSYWCVRLWEGELLLDADSSGTTVTITVPRNREGTY